MAPYGFSLEDNVVMGLFWFVLLCYMFMGIAIVSDIFMESIEQITAQTRLRTYVDNLGKE